jgi:hypothetical protein
MKIVYAICALLTGGMFAVSGSMSAQCKPPGTGPEYVVDWGGDYVQRVHTNRLYRGGQIQQAEIMGLDDLGNEIPLHVSYYAFSRSVPLNPVPEWVDPLLYDYDDAMPSAEFYGGMASFFREPRRIPEEGVLVDHWPSYLNPDFPWDEVVLRAGNSCLFHDEYDVRAYSVLLWRKDGFLNVDDPSQTVYFDADSNISINLSRKWFGWEEGRFVVEDQSGLWMSEFSWNPPVVLAWGCHNLALPQLITLWPTETQWAPYNPSGYDMGFDASTALWQSHDFTDIRSVGFYVGKHSLTSELTWWTVSDFEVQASVCVPAGNQPRQGRDPDFRVID